MHIQERFKNNDLPDIIMATYAPEDSIQKETLLDLSGYGFVQNYKASVLTNLSVDGGIYMLEGPSVVRGIGYNKTLFAEQGWSVPTSHEEFISPIKTIRADTDILPLPCPVYSGTYFTLMTIIPLRFPDDSGRRLLGEGLSRARLPPGGFGTGITLPKGIGWMLGHLTLRRWI